MNYYVYIIYSQKLKKKYIGVTKNLKERLKEHLGGRVPFTSITKDWKLKYYEVFFSKKDANTEERFLKTGKGRERLKYILADTLKK